MARKRRPKKKEVGLITSWLEAEHYTYGLDRKKAIRVLNLSTGMGYTDWRIKEWERGLRQVPYAARVHMTERCLPYVLKTYAGVTLRIAQDDWEAIAARLL